LEGERRPLGLDEVGLHLEHAGTEVDLHLLELTELSGEGRQRTRNGLGLHLELQGAEGQAAALVLSRPGADVEGEGDVRNLQREVDDGDAAPKRERREADEGATIQQPELGPRSLSARSVLDLALVCHRVFPRSSLEPRGSDPAGARAFGGRVEWRHLPDTPTGSPDATTGSQVPKFPAFPPPRGASRQRASA